MRSSRNSRAACLVAIVALTTADGLSAHRRDEYLQAARLAIAPAQVELELDLTPGIALAAQVIAEIDGDADGRVSREEARRYAGRVERDTHLEVDGRALPLRLVANQAPSTDAMTHGEGTLRLRWTAALPPLAAGSHRLRFTNAHHTDIGVYLANVLVPDSDRIAITGQDRDVDQRDFVVAYDLRGERSPWRGGALLMIVGGVVAAGALVRRSTRVSR